MTEPARKAWIMRIVRMTAISFGFSDCGGAAASSHVALSRTCESQAVASTLAAWIRRHGPDLAIDEKTILAPGESG
jgi:hypothetical protein